MDGRWNPFRDFLDLQTELMRTLERTLSGSYHGAARGFERVAAPDMRGVSWRPAIETFRRGNDLVVRVDLPGVSPGDVEVTVRERTLRIQGRRRHPEGVSSDDVMMEELAYGTFERRLDLPVEARTDKIAASFENGVLEVLVPQGSPEGAGGRKVPIGS